jgi:MCP family monocarboxylic acid transporter-like MFS transporter 10
MTEKTQCSTECGPSGDTVDTESCIIKDQEGGRAAWFTILGSVLVYYASFGILNSFGFFQDFYTNNFLKNSPASTIAFIGTLQMALMNSLAAVSGALCDRYGVTVS